MFTTILLIKKTRKSKGCVKNRLKSIGKTCRYPEAGCPILYKNVMASFHGGTFYTPPLPSRWTTTRCHYTPE